MGSRPATVDGVSPPEFPNASVIKPDHVALGCEAVRHLWVPVVHVRGEVIEKQEGKARTATETPVREPDVFDLDELGASGFVPSIGHRLLLERFQLSAHSEYRGTQRRRSRVRAAKEKGPEQRRPGPSNPVDAPPLERSAKSVAGRVGAMQSEGAGAGHAAAVRASASCASA